MTSQSFPLPANAQRCHRLCREAVDTFGLSSLEGLTVLTEAATGDFALTAPLAALAGARVLTLSRDSGYGSAEQAREATMALAREWGVAHRLEHLDGRMDPRLGTVHVATNLGAVRPLDADFLSRLGPFAAIPLMWETWEFRPEELDLPECHRLGIPVLGTDEGRPQLRIFRYVALAAVRQLLDSGIEIFRSRIALAGTEGFCSEIAAILRKMGAKPVRIDLNAPGNLPSGLDAFIVAEHTSKEPVLGAMALGRLAQESPGVLIAHICGAMPWDEVSRLGLRHTPNTPARPGYMSVTAGHAGPRAIVDLHAAGLKVGAELARARLRGLDGMGAELAVLRRCRFAQGFVGRHHAARSGPETA